MSWKWEVCENGRWFSNGLRFATKEKAEVYGADLYRRWRTMPEPARAAESDDPVTEKGE